MRSNENNYINRLRKGKEDALEFIIDKYLPLVKGTVYKVLMPINKEELIEECINDVFLSVWKNRNKFIGKDEDFRKWIYKVAKFKAIDYYRKEVRVKEVPLNDSHIGQTSSCEDEFLIIEDKKEVIKLINSLDEVDRKIFTMKFFLGIKSDDIGRGLGMSRSAVDNRIYRSKKKLSEKRSQIQVGGSLI